MIDLHHHCLPDVDDGPRAWGEAVEMCRIAREEGIETIVATPHVLRGRWKTFSIPELQARIDALRSRVGNAPRPLLGSEYFFAHDFADVLASVDARPLASAVPQNMKHPGPGRWWWLSFCDSFKPEGQQCLGVAVVEGKTLREAIEAAEDLGIHPGGRVASVACTAFLPAAVWRNRLLSREEVIAAGNSMEKTVA